MPRDTKYSAAPAPIPSLSPFTLETAEAETASIILSKAGTDGNGKASENGSESAGNNGAEDEADKTDASEESESAENDGKTESAGGTHIYVLTAAEDHGWTGSVATFAKEKAEEINGEGTYTAEVITANDAADQITKLEDIVNS